MVPVFAFTSAGSPVRVAAARVRLNAITAQTSHAAFAQKCSDGMRARAEFFRSACTCSAIACGAFCRPQRCPSRRVGSYGDETRGNAARRTVGVVLDPSAVAGPGIRRTINRPRMWWAFFCEAKAVNGIRRLLQPGFTAAFLHRRVRGYSISLHTSPEMVKIADLITESSPVVIEMSTPRTAASMVGYQKNAESVRTRVFDILCGSAPLTYGAAETATAACVRPTVVRLVIGGSSLGRRGSRGRIFVCRGRGVDARDVDIDRRGEM